MILFILAALLWVGVHVGIAGTAVRGWLAGRLGDNGFRGAFSLMSLAAISLLVIAVQDHGVATKYMLFRNVEVYCN